MEEGLSHSKRATSLHRTPESTFGIKMTYTRVFDSRELFTAARFSKYLHKQKDIQEYYVQRYLK
jgi:hypothetical protein